MKRLQRAALLTELVEQMRAHDSWCGETHLQKATYFLQELLDVEMDYDFVLYKHGPFSFDLRDELGDFVSDKLIRYQPQASDEQRAHLLREFKPHIPEPAALRAVRELDAIRGEAEALAA